MKVFDLFRENDSDHRSELARTGFWGRAAAGSILIARDTGRVCLAHRSPDVQEPNTWGMWGGAMDSGESPEQAALRELQEETGYSGSVNLQPLWTFEHSSGFRYYNFLAVVDSEFRPRMDWETQDFEWFDLADTDTWPSPLHPGVQTLLSRNDVQRKLMLVIKNIKQDQEPLNEKWSAKYKRSINCNNPKGFSQRAHCQGRKKSKITEDIESRDNFLSVMRDLLPIAVKVLELKSLPKIKLLSNGNKSRPTFGYFDQDQYVISLAVQDRHPVDIARTFCHELVHYHQHITQGLDQNSGDTGSREENQANSVAGIILRLFNKKHPEYFNNSAINIRADEIVNERKKKRKKSNKAQPAYYGGYWGFYNDESNSSDSADGGGVEENKT
jgi:8-oxo-dGTP pyrophosphatase MutT (NUDIX family)